MRNIAVCVKYKTYDRTLSYGDDYGGYSDPADNYTHDCVVLPFLIHDDEKHIVSKMITESAFKKEKDPNVYKEYYVGNIKSPYYMFHYDEFECEASWLDPFKSLEDLEVKFQTIENILHLAD